jgi:hypothetical protein
MVLMKARKEHHATAKTGKTGLFVVRGIDPKKWFGGEDTS